MSQFFASGGQSVNTLLYLLFRRSRLWEYVGLDWRLIGLSSAIAFPFKVSSTFIKGYFAHSFSVNLTCLQMVRLLGNRYSTISSFLEYEYDVAVSVLAGKKWHIQQV